jgi:hypothetical protein
VESLPNKRRIVEKKGGARIEKKKERRNLSGKAPCFEKRKEREDEINKLLGETLSKERKKERKEITISYSAKFDLWHHPYPHIICICTTFYSLTFPFLTPIHYTTIYKV